MSPHSLIVQETAEWLALNKPHGLHSIGDGNSVESWLRTNYPAQNNLPEAGVLHRLDQPTSGVLLVAKTPDSFQTLHRLFREESPHLKKIYLAWVEGLPPPTGHFDLYFSSRYKRSKKVSVARHGSPQERGRCVWKLLWSNETSSIVEVELQGPGRRHQIRAGMAFLGFPLKGDELYRAQPETQIFGLHALKLILHSKTIEASAPESWPLYQKADRRN